MRTIPWCTGKTGLKISPVFSALKMTWLRRNRPDIWQKDPQNDRHSGLGALSADRPFRDRSHLWQPHQSASIWKQRNWDPELLSLFEVEAAHALRSGGAGFDCRRADAGDGRCDRLAGGIAGGFGRRRSAMRGARSGLVFGRARGVQYRHRLLPHRPRRSPALDEGMRLACNVSAVPGAYIVEAAVLTSGTIYRWFSESLFKTGDSPGNPFALINARQNAFRRVQTACCCCRTSRAAVRRTGIRSRGVCSST